MYGIQYETELNESNFDSQYSIEKQIQKSDKKKKSPLQEDEKLNLISKDNLQINNARYIFTKISLFITLILTGNLLFFLPEKNCPYQNDEDCVRYFIDPNLTKWVIMIFISVMCFFSQALIFIFRNCSFNLKYKTTHQLLKNSEESVKKTTEFNEDCTNSITLNQEKLYEIKYSKYMRLQGILGFINQLCIHFFTSDYVDPLKYPGAFKLAFTTMTIIVWIIFFVAYSCIKLYKKFRLKCVALTISLILVLIISFYIIKVQNSCENWLKGVNKNAIENGEYCQIVKPDQCWATVLHGLFDLSVLAKECKNQSFKPQLSTYNKYIKQNFQRQNNSNKYNYIGYPDTTNFTNEQRGGISDNEYVIQKTVLSNAVFYDTVDQAKQQGHEIIVDVKKQKVLYNIQRKEEIVKKRRDLAKKNSNGHSMADNIIVIFIDAISRRAAHRQIPETLKYMGEDKNNFYEFFRYHSIRKSTTENLLQLFYNSYDPEEKPELFTSSQEKKEIIFEKIKNQGYITAQASNLCQTKSLQYGGSIYDNFENSPMDHEGFALACDPTYQNPENPYGFFQGPYSTVRRCFYQKDSFQHVFDYSLQFKKQYQGEKTFQYLEFLDSHEGTGELVRHMDGPLKEYLKKVDDGNTLIMLVSDHGNHMSEWTVLLHSFRTQLHQEMALAMLFIKFPVKNNFMTEIQKKEIDINQQKFITMANLHYTLRQMTGEQLPVHKEFPSLFQPVDSKLDCYTSIINLSGNYCGCKNIN